ncbi:hypothetical protein DFH07DRAFT_961794 [Mycena maculata]|uniref:Uncharacterized protein n=1 Tax=Mycena maculata TaxID=230809 RepID=A0AAD7ITA4_9AGAR|nr:hypothetical protein DFH07DRAFT_961794 [Mycena maculata]
MASSSSSVLQFEFQDRVVYYHVKDGVVPTFEQAIAYCRTPEVFGAHLGEYTDIEFPVELVEGEIQGSPASGKTILLHLLHHQLRQQGKEVYRFDEVWPTAPSKRDELLAELTDLQNVAFETNTETIVLIDEGQATYTDDHLWNVFFKAWAGDLKGPFAIIIACAYGSVSSHVLTKGPYTPIQLEASQKIGLRRSVDAPLGLLFETYEVEELLQRGIATGDIPRIDQRLKDLIYYWTQGYISVVSAFIKMLIRSKDIYTLEAFIHDYPQETMLQALAANGQCRRFLPSDETAADPRVIRVFSRLLVDEEIHYKEGDENPGGLDRNDLDFVHEKGLIYIEQKEAERRISFIFPLQRGLLQLSLRPPPFDGLDDIATLFSLIIKVIKLFNPNHLSSPRRVNDSLHDPPLEATFQHEFYRCLYQLRPRALISPQYSTATGHTPTGRLDFLVHRQEADDSRSWGIELLRERDRVLEHAHRLDPGGAYNSMISDGMTEFSIIDFRTSVKPQHLVYAVFSDAYNFVDIYDHNNINQLVGADQRTLGIDQCFVLQRDERAAKGKDAWPLVAISHQMVVRETPGVLERDLRHAMNQDGGLDWIS